VQTPGQIVFAPNANKAVIPSARDSPVLAKSPSEVFLSENKSDAFDSPGIQMPSDDFVSAHGARLQKRGGVSSSVWLEGKKEVD
jgi:hypothetical protein